MKRIAVVGGGLAGCAAAYVLKAAGHDVVIYEAGGALASGASGNALGLYNPRFAALWSPQSQYYSAAFKRVLDVFPKMGGIGFDPCGALYIVTDERKAIQFSKMIKSWGWDDDEMRIVDADEATRIAGVEIGQDSLYLPQAGSVNPVKLCEAYARGIEVRPNGRVECVDDLGADIVILTAGKTLKDFIDTKHIGFQLVRGQVSMLRADDMSAGVNCNLCYGGYVSRANNGQHMVGATFQRWLNHDDVMSEDDDHNLEKLYRAVPSFPKGLEVVNSWASVRTSATDYFPVVGRVRDNVYVSSAHGSHGILSSLLAAEVLAAEIDNKPQALSQDVLDALCPARFVD